MRKLRKESPKCRAMELIVSHMDEVRRNGTLKLLSERELSEKFSTSRVTVRNVIKELTRRGFIINLPRRGNFVNSRNNPPRFTVGIINGDGSESDYTDVNIELLTDILGYLNKNSCLVKFVSSPNLKNRSHLLFSHHGLDGLLWISPPESIYPEIRKIGMSPDCPVVSVVTSGFAHIPFSGNYVSLDYENVGKIRAEFFLKRKQRNVAYIGNSGITYDSFRKTFADAGIKVHLKCLLENESEIQERLPSLLMKKEVSAIVSDGLLIRLEEVFQVLSEFSGRDGITLMVDWMPELPSLMAKHPLVRVDAVTRRQTDRKLGVVAAESVIRALTDRRLQPPVLFESIFTDTSGIPVKN
jgi:hypothetical protein